MKGKYDTISFTTMKNKKIRIEYWTKTMDEKKHLGYIKKTKTICAISNKKKSALPKIRNVFKMTIPKSSDFLSFSDESVSYDVHNLITILDGGPLAYNILDYYVSIMIQEGNFNSGSGILKNRCQNVELDTVPCYFLPLNHGANVTYNISPDFDESPRIDLKNSIVFAPLISCRHYFLAVYDFPNKTINIFDSALYYNSQDIRFHHALNLWKVLIARMTFENSTDLDAMMDGWKCFFETDCAQQEDSVSCGYYVIYFIQNLLNGNPEKCSQPISTGKLRTIQESILKKVLPTTEIGKKFLAAISM